MTCSAGFTFRPLSCQDSGFSLVVAQRVSNCATNIVWFVADSMCFECGAHWAGVLCSSAPLAGYVLDLVACHSLGKVAGGLECLHDILLSGSDIDEEGRQRESAHVLYILSFRETINEVSDARRHGFRRGYLREFIMGRNAQPFSDEASCPFDLRQQGLGYLTRKPTAPIYYPRSDLFLEETSEFFSGSVD